MCPSKFLDLLRSPCIKKMTKKHTNAELAKIAHFYKTEKPTQIHVYRTKFCQNAPFRSVTVIFGLPFFFSPWGLRKSSMSEYSSGSGCRKQAHFTTRSKKPTATSMPPIHKNSNRNDVKPASSLN